VFVRIVEGNKKIVRAKKRMTLTLERITLLLEVGKKDLKGYREKKHPTRGSQDVL
jgi:hypothetical protein